MSKNKAKLNNYRIFSLGILGILALGLVASLVVSFLPKEASADYNPRIKRSLESEIQASNPRPAVYSLNPNPVRYGSGENYIIVHGTNFAYGAVARLNNSDRTTNFKNSTELNFLLLDSDTLRSGDYTVTVYNPGPGGGLSNGVRFTIMSPVAVARLDYVPSSATSSVRNANVSTGEVMGESVSGENQNFSSLAGNVLYGDGTAGFKPSGLTQWLIFAILVLLVVIVVRKLYFQNKYQSTPLKHA